MDGSQAARARGGLRARAHGLRQGQQPAGDGAHRPLRPDDASALLAPGAQPAGQSVRVPLRPTERRRRPRGQVSGDLFGKAEPVAPLADALRPKSLDEVVGQEHLIGPGKPLRLAFESGRPHSMILWGPPGSGKTTIARLMAKAFNAEFVALSAVFSGVKDIRDAIAAAQARLEQFGRRTILFVDEVHRFNKAQQDAFLPFVEQGLITFVGATTENPSFEVNSARLSRATGDFVEQTLATNLRRFDKGGEQFYDQISALHKAVRGSDPDASLYWMVRMLDGGADPRYIGRRVVRMAVEDIGLADAQALRLALDACETYERLGSPEGELALAEAVIYLAVAPKSNAVYAAYNSARAFVAEDGTRPVPLHLRNAPTRLMKQLGYGKGYRYAHDEEGAHAAGETYLPEGMGAVDWYRPTDRGLEAKIREKLAELRRRNEQARS